MKKLFTLLGFVVSAAFLYLTFRNTDFALIVVNLGYVKLYYVAAAAVVYFLFYVSRALYQMNNLSFLKGDIRFRNSLTSIALSLFFNVIFPARLGEVVRTFYLSKSEGLKKTSILSYIIVEKLVDFLFMLLLLLFLLLLGFSGVGVKKIALIGSAIAAAVVVIIIVYVAFNTFVMGLLKAVIPERFRDAVARLNESALEGFRFYRSAGQVLRGIALLVAGWFFVACAFWLVSETYMRMMGLPLYSPLFFMVFSALSLAIPSAPAGIGVVHYGLYLAVETVGGIAAVQNQALVGAFTIVVHFLMGMTMDLLIGGLIALFHRVGLGEKLLPQSVKTAADGGMPL